VRAIALSEELRAALVARGHWGWAACTSGERRNPRRASFADRDPPLHHAGHALWLQQAVASLKELGAVLIVARIDDETRRQHVERMLHSHGLSLARE